jgi:hypothetical protein
MAVDAARSRRRAKEAGRAAKARREKITLGAGILILALLLALEGPKTLNALKGSSPAPASTATQTTAHRSQTAVAAPTTVSLKSLKNYSVKDPFVQQVGGSTSGTGTPSTVSSVKAPAVRTEHFVPKDPFAQQIQAAAPATVFVQSVASHGASAAAAGAGSTIVILASVSLQQGRLAAEKAAAGARTQGIPNVNVALSSNYPTLRRGYFAVYSGPYPTLDRALAMLETVRSLGYVNAYTRRLAR